MVQDVKRPGVTTLMKTLAYKQAEVNRTLWCIAQDVQLGRSMGTMPGRHESVPSCSDVSTCKDTRLIVDDEQVRIFRHLEHLENYVIPLAIRLQSVPVYMELTGTGKTVYEGSLTVSLVITMVWLKRIGNMQIYLGRSNKNMSGIL